MDGRPDSDRDELQEVYKRRLGRDVRKVPLHRIEDGINATRQLLGICEFDAGPCSEGTKSLKNYRKEWDEERGVWRDRPRHDAYSHGADAFRSLAMIYRAPIEAKPEGPLNPRGEVVPIKSLRRDFKVLSEMTYDEAFPLDGARARRRDRPCRLLWPAPRRTGVPPQNRKYRQQRPPERVGRLVRNNGKYDADDDAHQRHDISNAQEHDFPFCLSIAVIARRTYGR
jgi:hypothetical protein